MFLRSKFKEKPIMSMYNLDNLVRMWATEQITMEQIIGQMLLHLNDLKTRIGVLEQRQPPEHRPLDSPGGSDGS
jgi:hypothetical protein